MADARTLVHVVDARQDAQRNDAGVGYRERASAPLEQRLEVATLQNSALHVTQDQQPGQDRRRGIVSAEVFEIFSSALANADTI